MKKSDDSEGLIPGLVRIIGRCLETQEQKKKKCVIEKLQEIFGNYEMKVKRINNGELDELRLLMKEDLERLKKALQAIGMSVLSPLMDKVSESSNYGKHSLHFTLQILPSILQNKSSKSRSAIIFITEEVLKHIFRCLEVMKDSKLQRFFFGGYIKDGNNKSFDIDGVQPGRAYFINHRTFNDTNLRERKGSEHDLKRLQEVFKRFGMKTKTLEDGTKADVRAVMKEVSEYDFKNLSCVVVVIMSHGSEGDIVLAKDDTYSLNKDIMYALLQNSSLRSKPKFLFVEACKGPVNPLLQIEAVGPVPTEIPDEILQLNSCVEGFVSYLKPDKGSIFIYTLCNHLEQYGMTKCIVNLTLGVVKHVKENYSDIQIPMLHTNLTKRFVFGDYIRNHRIVEEHPGPRTSSGRK